VVQYPGLSKSESMINCSAHRRVSATITTMFKLKLYVDGIVKKKAAKPIYKGLPHAKLTYSGSACFQLYRRSSRDQFVQVTKYW
jgi:hypothetical protein